MSAPPDEAPDDVPTDASTHERPGSERPGSERPPSSDWPSSDWPSSDWMALALAEARQALAHDDVPVGAVVVHGGEVIATRHNERELRGDPVAHAEILALRDAARTLGRWRLDGCTMYVTLEPCAMCAGAMVNARLGALVYAADDPKAGAAGSVYSLLDGDRLNHRVPVDRADHHAGEAGELLRAFFRHRRG
jgi:tRNA(adenine34) deaminase